MSESFVSNLFTRAEALFNSESYERRFLMSYEKLGIRRSDIGPRVLVIGGGPYVPEGALVCTDKSRFKNPYPNVTSVWVTDYGNAMVSPQRFNWKLGNGMNMKDSDVTTAKKMIISFPLSGQDLLARYPEVQFHTIIFLGARDFVDQINHDFLTQIYNSLAPGGVFIGAGGARSARSLREVLGDISTTKLRVRVGKEMDDDDDPAGPQNNRIGVILEK